MPRSLRFAAIKCPCWALVGWRRAARFGFHADDARGQIATNHACRDADLDSRGNARLQARDRFVSSSPALPLSGVVLVACDSPK